MKPDLYQKDFDGLVRQAEEMAARPRTLYGIEPTRDDAGSTPFEWMLHVLWKAFELLGAAVLLVVILALAFSGGPKP